MPASQRTRPRQLFAREFRADGSGGQLVLLEGDAEIAPGVELIRVPGHNADMQCVRLTGGGKTAFLFADLVPTTAHLPLPWIMGFDLYPMTTLENKKKWIPEMMPAAGLALSLRTIRKCRRRIFASARESIAKLSR